MLAENLETWTDQWKREGLEQGLELGLEQGLEQGREATRHILVRQVRRRFGPTIAEQTQLLLAGIADLQTFEDLGEQLLISPDGDDWLKAERDKIIGDED
ncbi:transposase [Thiocapsa sp.]|uniref:transposase n=1 Tax=Thiocapsa sp. TaxID=2024551 RepID=UPI002B87E812|nr:transposase [Thiocapsa sp.]HSO83541.1 transposase [Thiocapsa sp.]